MKQDHIVGVGLATITAGPSVILTTVAAELYLRMPEPISIDLGSVLALLGIAFLAGLYGVVIALPVNAIGTLAMLALGDWCPLAKLRIAWAMVAAALGASCAWLLEAPDELRFGLIVSSAFCGWLCSRRNGVDREAAACGAMDAETSSA